MSSAPLDRYAFGPVAAVRPWLFARALHLLLAFDVWHTLVGPAWRYGAAGFNVAHFAVLDAILPLPTREAYVGMLVVVGAMSFVAAFLPKTPRALSIAITLLYTWGWSCSMLDSYQHHYLITTLLFTTCLLPQHTATDLFGGAGDAPAPRPAASAPARAKKGKRKSVSAPDAAPKAAAIAAIDGVARVRSVGWTMAMVFSGIVYAFTAVSKAEPDWRSGAALRNITQDGASMPGAMAVASSLGIDRDTLWPLLGTGMIFVQVVCALGYLAAPLRDGAADPRARRWLAALGTVALVLALQFHVGAEYIGLQIGWFSYYMIVLALVALTPASWLARLAAELTAVARGDRPSPFVRTPVLAPALGVLGVCAGAFVGAEIDLPGAYGAALAVGVAGLALGAGAMLAPEHRAALGRGALAVPIALVCCWIAMTRGDGRYDFYRFAGGDFRRRGDYPAALEAYRQANRYAPEGQSRQDRIREMEDAIRRQGGTP